MAAVENVGDAYHVARRFLLPFEAPRWLKLAVVVFFVGGGMNLPSAGIDSTTPSGDVPTADVPASLPGELLPILVGIGAVIAVVGLAFVVISAIMEFVLIESLRHGRVALTRYWGRRWRQGLRLVAFRIVFGVSMLGLVLGWVGLLVGPLVLDVGGAGIAAGVFLLGLPVILLVGVLYGLVSAFTTSFVVPIMITEDCGVIAGWRRLWHAIADDWQEYLVYALLALVLSVVLGFLASFLVGIVAIFLLVPLGAIAVLTHLTVSFSSVAGIAVLVGLTILFGLAVLVLFAVVNVPVVVYLRYYPLLVMGDLDETLDLIPEQRAAVRS